MYSMSRHFVWVGPLSNLLLFIGLGLLLAMATKLWPRLGGWLGSRLVCSLAILPALFVVSGRSIPGHGRYSRGESQPGLVPILERNPIRMRRTQIRTFPALLGVVLVLAASMPAVDWLKERREASRPLPAGNPPNVLLIVMDTVRADHLSLYGYNRPTSPALEALAGRGIRFDQARATAPWTLPSHASIFTGRWPHELDVDWQTPLGTRFPTLAEDLAAHGYATAGFAGNAQYCSYEFGLNRGFSHYEDYVIEPMSPLRMCTLGDLALKGASRLGWMLSSSIGPIPFLPRSDSLVWPSMARDARIGASVIDREFLRWLSAPGSRHARSSHFLTMLTLIRPTSCRPVRGTASGGRPRPMSTSTCSPSGIISTSSGCPPLT